MTSREIDCPTCGGVMLAHMEPVYDGFKKTGEVCVCTGCGTQFASAEEAPFVEKEHRPRLFTENDKPDRPAIFSDDERQRCCGWCRHFVLNPFTQRCGLSNKEMQATDLCVRFEKKPENEVH